MINRIRENFTQIDNNVLKNKEISLKAKGLYAFLCSKPNDWDFNYNGLILQLQEGEKSIRSGIKELVDAGYLLRYSKRKGGDFDGWEWIINPTEEDLKKYNDPFGKYPKRQVPETASTQNGKEISNTNLSNTNNSNTNNINKKNTKKEIELKFDLFYEKYPIKKSKQLAKKKFISILSKGEVNLDTLFRGLDRYILFIKEEGVAEKFVKHPSTWLNQGCWDDEYKSETTTKSKYETL